jgi:hypothetical protein
MESHGLNPSLDRKEFFLRTEAGAYDLQARVQIIGKDILIAVWGGNRPHIGAAAFAQTQPGIVDPNRKSTTVSVFCFPGHREDVLVRSLARDIAQITNSNIVVTAGTHWDHLDQKGIDQVLANGKKLTGIIQKTLREYFQHET